MKVTVLRNAGYDGPVEVELKNLPPGVTEGRLTIGQDKDSVEIELTAAEKTGAVEKKDVQAIAIAKTAGNQQVLSGAVTIRIKP